MSTPPSDPDAPAEAPEPGLPPAPGDRGEPRRATPGAPRARAGGGARVDSLAVFTFLWGMGVLAHQTSYLQWTNGYELALAAGALLAVARPRWTPALIVLATVQLVEFAWRLPKVANHWMLSAFVNVTILVAFARAVRASRRSGTPGVVDRAELFAGFAPVVRAQVVWFYFFVTFHKINAGFFDPEGSCGVHLYRALADFYPFFPDGRWAGIGAIHGTLWVEGTIPLLFLFARTRRLGILLAGAFHTFLATEPINVLYNFSTVLSGLFFLFAPPDLPRWAAETWAESRAGSRLGPWLREGGARKLALAATVLGVAVVVGAGALHDSEALRSILGRGTAGGQAFDWMRRLIWLGYDLALLACFWLVTRERWVPEPTSRAAFHLAHPALAALVVLLVLNGFSPYLGLKTKSSFAMFSNLRTEGGETNHYVIRGNLHLTGYPDDLVRILDSSDPTLRRIGESDYRLTFLDLRDRLSRRPDASIVYERDGLVHDVARAGDDPVVGVPPTWWERKLFYFRPVHETLRPPCRH